MARAMELPISEVMLSIAIVLMPEPGMFRSRMS